MNRYSMNIKEISKVYNLYNKPSDRFKEAISLSGKKIHKEFIALKDISFDVKQGEVIGIIGANGSGKSTLLKIITGVLTPTSGEVKVNGKVAALLELGAGFNPEYTGLENIYLNGTMNGFNKSELDNKIQGIIDFADIGDFIYQPVKTYSSGMFVRLAFAVALSSEPEILIIDEALAVGDQRFQAKCYKQIEVLKEKGKTIILVSHDIDSVRKFCSRCVWINKGELVTQGKVQEITAQYLEYINTDPSKSYKEVKFKDENTSVQERKSKFKPIKRWGSMPQLVTYVDLKNNEQHQIQCIEQNIAIEIDVDVNIPVNIKVEDVGVAFSIKNKKGLDIIVESTYDQKVQLNIGYNKLNFKLNNYLSAGEYYLSVAVEDRANEIPEYYDYIEGAYYFRVLSQKDEFGLLNVPVKITMN